MKTKELTVDELYEKLVVAAEKVIAERDACKRCGQRDGAVYKTNYCWNCKNKMKLEDMESKYPIKDPNYGTIMDANEEMWAATDYWKKFFDGK